MVVVSYNPLGRVRTEYVRIPVSASHAVTAYDASGSLITVSLTPVPGKVCVRTFSCLLSQLSTSQLLNLSYFNIMVEYWR